MDIPYIRGKVAHQAHVGLPEGTVEEEYGRNGFFGRYSHLYRTEAPVNWTRIEGPCKPQAFDLRKLEKQQTQNNPLFAQGQAILTNSDISVRWSMLEQPMDHFLRNADADIVVFVHAGNGRLETDYGPISYESGDYILIPRGTVYRFAPSSPTIQLNVEAYNEVTFPDRGMLGQHALFDPAVIQVPTPGEKTVLAPNNQGEYELRIIRKGQLTRVFYPFSPINTVGWKGTASVAKINVRDIRPVLSDRYHLPPSAHSTFVMRNAVICTFLPRPLENGDPKALKVPFYHSNIDFDEVIFYHSGEFFSRKGISAGMLTFHPQGIHHGPQPGAIDRSTAATRTEEVAVMIDTRNPLDVCEAIHPTENKDYWKSWMK